MSSSPKVLERMNERVTQLSHNFAEYLEFFSGSNNFVGPSIYFHNKTLAIRKKYATAKATISSDEFFDYLYATLTSWGMHRMGTGNTKLRDIQELKQRFRLQADSIQRFDGLIITEMSKGDVPRIAKELWDVLSQLTVSVAEAQIVANSKALHHLLPSLVPPIDRTYTYNFLYNRNMLTLSESEAFQEIYSCFCDIAISNKELIKTRIGTDWNTSETKTIDNAIVGYVLKELRISNNE
jgi:hypothetical protein